MLRESVFVLFIFFQLLDNLLVNCKSAKMFCVSKLLCVMSSIVGALSGRCTSSELYTLPCDYCSSYFCRS